MKTDTREKILSYIAYWEPITVKDIVNHFEISNEMVHRHLKRLLTEGKIEKIWTPPKVYYFWVNKELDYFEAKLAETRNIIEKENKIIGNNFVYFSPNWEVTYWFPWFKKWCIKRKIDPIKESNLYLKTLEKYNKYKNKKWFIDWQDKMLSTFDKVYLDKTFYFDFYSIEKYWKTLLWNLMLYAKQTNDKDLAIKVIDLIYDKVYSLINTYNVDSFSFIPPSIDRKVQLMDELKKWLNINLKELKLLKIFRDKAVPQKSLNKKEDRIINASQTIFIWDKDFKSDTILLIDDAIWSWATLNETAKKIKQKWKAKKVIWLAIVWSFKWFDVINEV